MSHSPLFSRLRRALSLAQVSNNSGMGAAETLERALSRRRFLQISAAAGAAAMVGGCASTPADDTPEMKNAPKVAIIGGGLAGLNCAYQLKKKGLRATVYEAAQRFGGRCFTKHDVLGEGLYTEIGGEFMDSTHKEILDLCREFELELLDKADDHGLEEETWFAEGKRRSETELIEEFKRIVPMLRTDFELSADEKSPRFAQLDKLSLTRYLNQVKCEGWLRSLVDCAFVTEYGLDTIEQSALNFVTMLDLDTSRGFNVFGDSDERFKLKGGNQKLADALCERLQGQLETGRKLVRMQKRGSRWAIYFERGDTEADFVVLALPFTTLREVDLYCDFSPEKQKAIKELGYGANCKVMFGTKTRPWRKQGSAGYVFSDLPFQMAWDNARMIGGEAGGITFYSGGTTAQKLGEGTPREALDKLLPSLDAVFKSVSAEFNGHFQRMHWPTHPFAKAGYSAYKVGQWTSIRGHEATPENNIYFAGEHCSRDFQGFLNGAIETGRTAAEAIVARAKR